MPFPLQMTEPAGDRVCGPCQACCTTLNIEVLGKPERVACSYLCESGCSIYEDRPQTCRDFRCLWLSGHLAGDERRRPDNLGVMLHFSATPVGTLIMVWELRDGALESPSVAYLLNKLRTKYLLCVMLYAGPGLPGRRMFVGPGKEMARVQKFKEDFLGHPPV